MHAGPWAVQSQDEWAFMDDIEKEDAALPLVVDQARPRLSGLNYPEASLDVSSHAIELAARATASMKSHWDCTCPQSLLEESTSPPSGMTEVLRSP
jgi:hypothetical protein